MPRAKPPPDPDQARRVRGVIAYGPYNQKQIARALGIEGDQLRRYLRAELSFQDAQLRMIAQMCNVSLRLLYEPFPPYETAPPHGPPGELGRVLPSSPPTEPRHNQ